MLEPKLPDKAAVGDASSPLAEFLANADNEHKRQGNPSVKCNAVYKTKDNVNALLKPSQAIELARHLLQKAQIIIDNQLDDAAVHLWNQGLSNERFYCGLNTARKGPRRKKKKV